MKENVDFRRNQIIISASEPKYKTLPELPDAYMNILKQTRTSYENVTAILNYDCLFMSLQNEYVWSL